MLTVALMTCMCAVMIKLIESPFFLHNLLQILNTCHLLCIVGGICCMGVLLILAKTIAQALTTPELVTDSEEPLGTTVCMLFSLF